MVSLASWTNNYSFCDLRGAPNFSTYFTRDFRLSLKKLRMNTTKSNALFLIGWETTNAKLHATLLANQRQKYRNNDFSVHCTERLTGSYLIIDWSDTRDFKVVKIIDNQESFIFLWTGK